MRTQARLLLAHTVVVQAVTFMLRPASEYRALDLDVPAAWLGVLGASFAVVRIVRAAVMAFSARDVRDRSVSGRG